MRHTLAFEHALTPDGVRHDQRLVIDDEGRIERLETAGGGPYDGFFALPGMPNAHSHAFQRALCGYGEAAAGGDSFWTWREAMYRLAAGITPEDMHAIARQAFADMLRAGFTCAGEFHYVHHLPGGERSAAMGEAVVAAARETGIRLALLPVYYETGDFARPPAPGQARFVHTDPESFCELVGELGDSVAGIAPHSLRAVPAERLEPLLGAAAEILGPDFRVHIHIAEQQREVDACRASHGCGPIELLAESITLDARWSLVHATHASAAGLATILQTGARVILCPLTEANLGDGLMRADAFAADGGEIAIGSDSNARIDAVEELRLLEYGQRLRSQQRARFADRDGLGASLWRRAASGGAAALGLAVGALEPGRLADIVVLDADSAPLLGVGPARVPDALVVGGSADCVRDVYVGGRRVVHERTIGDAVGIASAFAGSVRRLLG